MGGEGGESEVDASQKTRSLHNECRSFQGKHITTSHSRKKGNRSGGVERRECLKCGLKHRVTLKVPSYAIKCLRGTLPGKRNQQTFNPQHNTTERELETIQNAKHNDLQWIIRKALQKLAKLPELMSSSGIGSDTNTAVRIGR